MVTVALRRPLDDLSAPTKMAAPTPPTDLAACLAAGVYIAPAEIPIDVWISHGQTLSRRWAALLWLVADWARTGVDYFGPLAWTPLSTISGRDRDTLRKMVATSRRFPLTRRRLGIPFSRHSAVATLPDADADRLLARAEREGWNQQDLYRHVRVYRGQPTRPKPKRQSRPAAPTATPTQATIVVPAVTGYRQTAPVRCSGCWLVVAYAAGARAVMSTGPAAVQRVADGRLVMSVECTGCQSSTLVSLSMLEIPVLAERATGLVAGA